MHFENMLIWLMTNLFCQQAKIMMIHLLEGRFGRRENNKNLKLHVIHYATNVSVA